MKGRKKPVKINIEDDRKKDGDKKGGCCGGS